MLQMGNTQWLVLHCGMKTPEKLVSVSPQQIQRIIICIINAISTNSFCQVRQCNHRSQNTDVDVLYKRLLSTIQRHFSFPSAALSVGTLLTKQVKQSAYGFFGVSIHPCNNFMFLANQRTVSLQFSKLIRYYQSLFRIISRAWIPESYAG